MAVYLALQRLNGAVGVVSVLNADSWEEAIAERKDTYESDYESDGADNQFMQKCYLSRGLESTIFGDETEEDKEMDPEQLTYIRKKSKFIHEKVPYFPRTNVTWLNGSPQSFEELAAVYIAVSSSLSIKTRSANSPQYGNQPSVGAFYSAAVIIANVPSFEERKVRWMDSDRT